MSTGQVISGRGTSFVLDDSVGGTPTDISTFLNSLNFDNSQEELDGTNFQPGVSDPTKNYIPGFSDRSGDSGGNWSSNAEVFFTAVNGLVGLNYEYGPDGTDPGKPKIYGLCNVSSYSGPKSSMGMTVFSVKFRITTRTLGVFT